MLFIGLNPSTASDSSEDQTLNRLLSFCRSWGYGSLVVVNLFAKVSKSPLLLRSCIDPVGEGNDQELSLNADIWSKNHLWDLWLGWGAGGVFLNLVPFDVNHKTNMIDLLLCFENNI